MCSAVATATSLGLRSRQGCIAIGRRRAGGESGPAFIVCSIQSGIPNGDLSCSRLISKGRRDALSVGIGLMYAEVGRHFTCMRLNRVVE